MFARTPLRFAAALLFVALASAAAHAQLFRAYLAPTGNDANPCTLQQPCRLLPAALAAVASGGEIWMLDSANYNTATVNIAKSVAILAVPGVVGSIVAAGGPAIEIASGAFDVALRNLVIVPLPGAGGTYGVLVNEITSLTVEKCLIANLANSGIFMESGGALRVVDTTIRNNGDHGMTVGNGATASVTRAVISGNPTGIQAITAFAGPTTTLDVANSTLDRNATAVFVRALGDATRITTASIRDSTISGGGSGSGLVTSGALAGGVARLAVSNSLVSGSNIGIEAFGPGTRVWISGNTVSGNFIGLSNSGSGAVFESAGNNAVRNNTTSDTVGTISVIAPQ